MSPRQWLFPATDAGVAAQVAVVLVLWCTGMAVARRASAGARTFVFGLGFLAMSIIAAMAVLH